MKEITYHIMENFKCLPILLISAKDQDAANKIISEIIDDKSGDGEANQIEHNKLDRVWKITNKYYTANVRVYALLDGEDLEAELINFVEAHLIYFSENECKQGTIVECMHHRAQASREAHVRLVVADVITEPPALAAACARDHCELISLRELAANPDDSDEERDELGVDRVRAALHAHLWPGLERHVQYDSRVPLPEVTEHSSDDEWSEWCEGPSANQLGVTDTEDAFFAALATLPSAAATARQTAGSREERLARAEQLVAAFCHALGTPFD